MRPSGMLRASRSPQRSTIALDILLGNHPGAIAFTLILWRPHLTARSRVKLMSPPLLVLYAIDHRTHIVDVGDVTAQAECADPQRRELGGRLHTAFGVACAEHHVRAHLRERGCHLPPEPAASTGDDGDPPAEVE